MPPGALPRHSFRARVTTLTLSVLTVIGAAFAWTAYRDLKGALTASTVARMEAAAGQVGTLLADSARARIAETERLARDPGLLVMLADPATPLPPQVLSTLNRSPQVAVLLYGPDGRLVREATSDSPGMRDRDQPLPAAVPVIGASPLQRVGNRVWYFTTVPIEGTAERPLGFLSIRRPLTSSQSAQMIERLIGSGAIVRFGNVQGDVWTDLSGASAAAVTPNGEASWAKSDERRVGASVQVPESPWEVWVGIPEPVALAPAAALLRGLLPITLLFIAVGGIATYVVSGRLTRPLETLSLAADAIAVGDYSRRVVPAGTHEVSRLGTAFNVMAARVASDHESLERRVHERTEALERTQAELDRFFSLSLDLLCIADTEGRFRRINPAWEQTLGWTSSELLGVAFIDFVHPDDRRITLDESTRLSEGGHTTSFENRYRCRNGSYKWLSWKAASVPEEGRIYAAARDVTDQKRLERALHSHGAQLEAANRELEAFSYSVSHDLRAPLRHIAGFAALLHKNAAGALDEQGRRYLDTISEAARQMGRLVDDLLGFSRMSRADMLKNDVDLGELVRDVVEEAQRDVPGRRISWRIGPLPVVTGDRALLRLALTNLIRNAIKYSAKREVSEIEIGTGAAARAEHVIYVKDNGAGFDMAYADKLFGVFQRLHSAEDFEGTGIGLANVRRVIQRHGGRTWAEGKVDAGATFYFSLPDPQEQAVVA